MNTTQLPNGNTINVNGTSSNDGLSVISIALDMVPWFKHW